MKKINSAIIFGSAAILSGGFLFAATNQPQSIRPGHQAGIQANCINGWSARGDLFEWDKDHKNNNKYEVLVDGVVVDSGYFNDSFTAHGLTDRNVRHLIAVRVDANLLIGDPTRYDSYNVISVEACPAPTSTTTIPEITTTTSTTIPEITTTTSPCREDEECWDCETMGNKICGTTTTTVNIPDTSEAPTTTVKREDTPTVPSTAVKVTPTTNTPITENNKTQPPASLPTTL